MRKRYLTMRKHRNKKYEQVKLKKQQSVLNSLTGPAENIDDSETNDYNPAGSEEVQSNFTEIPNNVKSSSEPQAITSKSEESQVVESNPNHSTEHQPTFPIRRHSVRKIPKIKWIKGGQPISEKKQKDPSKEVPAKKKSQPKPEKQLKTKNKQQKKDPSPPAYLTNVASSSSQSTKQRYYFCPQTMTNSLVVLKNRMAPSNMAYNSAVLLGNGGLPPPLVTTRTVIPAQLSQDGTGIFVLGRNKDNRVQSGQNCQGKGPTLQTIGNSKINENRDVQKILNNLTGHFVESSASTSRDAHVNKDNRMKMSQSRRGKGPTLKNNSNPEVNDNGNSRKPLNHESGHFVDGSASMLRDVNKDNGMQVSQNCQRKRPALTNTSNPKINESSSQILLNHETGHFVDSSARAAEDTHVNKDSRMQMTQNCRRKVPTLKNNSNSKTNEDRSAEKILNHVTGHIVDSAVSTLGHSACQPGLLGDIGNSATRINRNEEKDVLLPLVSSPAVFEPVVNNDGSEEVVSGSPTPLCDVSSFGSLLSADCSITEPVRRIRISYKRTTDPDPPKLKPLSGAAGASGVSSPLGRPPAAPSVARKTIATASTNVSTPASKPSATVVGPSPSSNVPLENPMRADQSDGEVCLRWNSHHSNMQTSFPSLLDNEQYVDVTLAADGRVIKCHRLILSSCSTYFDEILKGIAFPQHPVIFLKDIPFWVVKALVDFMYRGEVNIDQSKLPDLLHAAEILQVKGLAGKHSTEEPKLPKDTIPKATFEPRSHSQDQRYAETEDVEESTSYSKLEQPSTSKITSPPSPKRHNRKRKSAPPVVEVPEEMPMLRRGTKSRPNVKQPKYYDQEYDDIPSPEDSYSESEAQPGITSIKVEPIDVYESDITFNLPVDLDNDPFSELNTDSVNDEPMKPPNTNLPMQIKQDLALDPDDPDEQPSEHDDGDEETIDNQNQSKEIGQGTNNGTSESNAAMEGMLPVDNYPPPE